MNVDQNMGTSPATSSDNREVTSSPRDAPLNSPAMPAPVAASAHANTDISASPITEWLNAVSPEASQRSPEGRHRKNHTPPRG